MIYLIADLQNSICKIGYSKHPYNRLKELQTANAFELTLTNVIEGDKSDESWLHDKFEKFKLLGEWFTLTNEINTYFLEQYELQNKPITLNNIYVDSSAVNYLNVHYKNYDLNKLKSLLDKLYKEGIFSLFQDDDKLQYIVMDSKSHNIYEQLYIFDKLEGE